MDVQGFNLQKQIEESYKVEQELMKKLDSEIEQDEELEAAARSIAEGLVKSSKVRTMIGESEFSIAMKIQPRMVKKMHAVTKDVIEVPEDHIVLIAANVTKYNLVGGKYIPFTATAKVDKNYSLLDNTVAVVKGLLGHITGNIKPEVLE